MTDNGHDQHLNFQQKNIINHDWTFFSSSKATVLNAGKYSWPFELLLPGNLPETFTSDIGKISYCLSATVDKPSFIQHTITKKRPIRVQRCIFPFDQSLYIHNTWAEKLTYDINVPSRTFAFNDTIPISIRLSPIAPHLKVHSIIVSLKEYATYTANSQSITNSRVVRMACIDSPFPLEHMPWNTLLHLTVPPVLAYADSELISIRHKLKYSILLVNADGHISEVRCASSIDIIESFALTEELSTLPAYNEMWRSIECPPLEEDNEEHSNYSPSCSSDEDEDKWHGMDLTKLPSYHSVANCNPSVLLGTTTFPPSYETCI